MSEQREKFERLLRELFQFDCADLDFGIYRIMNHKRDVIEKFIREDLLKAVSTELDEYIRKERQQVTEELQAVGKEIVESLGHKALDGDNKLTITFHNTPLGKRYLRLQEGAGHERDRESLERDIFNRLYCFFGRYYQEGDFISKRRYSKNQRYVIPYNGEEVLLHWTNSDQYYIKTAEHFQDYRFKADNVSVHFHLQNANVEQNNVKGEKRFFMALAKEMVWDEKDLQLRIPFEYRPLTVQEKTHHPKNRIQEALNASTLQAVPAKLDQAPGAKLALTAEYHKNSNGDSVSVLEHHLRQYTRRNTSDFFIHKDLRGFLSRELDFYLKNEVLNLDHMEAADDVNLASSQFQLMRLIKKIGRQIIDFLEQIESFQKMLWEKRKFITETQYCITVGNIDQSFYSEIADCETQWEEWKELFRIDEEEPDLLNSGKNRKDKRTAFLKDHSTLVLDTRHFQSDFVDRLISSYECIEAITDGLLISSDNFHTLNLLSEMYHKKIQCIYIDPPYNTDASAILYKNDYKNSSWLCMMESRLLLARNLLRKTGILCCAIDDEEVYESRVLLAKLFSKEIGVVVVRSNPAGRKTKGTLAPAHEYALFHGNPDAVPEALEKSGKSLKRYPHQDKKGRYAWANFIRSGSGDKREDRPRSFYPIFVSDDDAIRVPKIEWNEEKRSYKLLEEPEKNEVPVYPIVTKGDAKIEKRWHRGYKRVEEIGEFRIRRDKNGNISIDFKTRLDEQGLPTTWWDDKKYASANYGAAELKAMFGEKIFDFAKSSHLVKDCIKVSGITSEQEIILDFFAGSGTTGHSVININRENGSNHKFILSDVEEYFDDVIVKRIKKASFASEWNEGRPVTTVAQNISRSPRIIKYMRLESYEDALNNISFEAPEKSQQALQLEDYLLNYMLRWETKNSETLLNVEELDRPFIYRLRNYSNGQNGEKAADLPETFNYLLGLQVQTRRVYDDEGRRYLVYRGLLERKTIVVIWRETHKWKQADYERDRKFVEDQGLTEGADEVFVNSDSTLLNAKSLDPLFKKRMFAPVET